MRRRALLLFLLLTPLFSVYRPILRAGYTNWDDPDYTINNPLVRDFTLHNLAHAFSAPRLVNYIPLTDLSLAVDSAVFGEKATTHHAVNLLFHAFNAVLVFLLLAALLGSDLAALGGALLWALHPVNVESAAWIAERKNLLYAFFYLAALLAYLRLKTGWNRTALVSVLFLLSLLSKASAVTLPLALLALDWRFGRALDRNNLLEKGAMLGAALVFTLLTAAAQGGNGALLPAPFPGLFSFYLEKAFWPAGLSALYPYAETLASLKRHAALYALPALAFGAALTWTVKKEKTAAFGLLFFLVNIMPFALLVPIGPSLGADRYLYLALAGLIIAIFSAGAPLAAGKYGRAGAAGLCLACVCAAGTLTAARLKTWQSSETLWSDVLAKYPRAEVANQNMAQALLEKGDWPRAQEYLERALAAGPANAEALYNLGTALARSGHYAQALPLLERSILINPDLAQAWNNLGLVFLRLDRRAEAVKAFLMASEIDPSFAPAKVNLSAARAAPAALRKKP